MRGVQRGAESMELMALCTLCGAVAMVIVSVIFVGKESDEA